MNGYTENLADFGYREQDEAKEIFAAWKKNGLPQDFENDGVRLAFNMNSGYVFLTNNEYQVAMSDGDALYSFYTSPYEGIEGSFEDLLDEYKKMREQTGVEFSSPSEMEEFLEDGIEILNFITKNRVDYFNTRQLNLVAIELPIYAKAIESLYSLSVDW